MTLKTRSTTALLALSLATAVSPAAAQRGPAAAATHLPADVLALACAPSLAFQAPPTPLRITGGQDSFVRRIYIPGDLVTINAGTHHGIEVGQEFYTRRVLISQRARIGRQTPGTIHTSGWIRVYAVDDAMSLATITHACDTVEIDDYLEPFQLPQVPVPDPDKPKAERDNYGRVMTGADQRRTFGKGDLFVLDRGSDHGVRPGMHFVIYRDKRQDENFLYELGEATALDVKNDTATLQVTLSRDAISEGDYVAMRK